jgi:hypothetical protein
MAEPILDVENRAFSILDFSLEKSKDGEGSQYMPATINRLFSPSNEPPWAFRPSIDDGINRSSPNCEPPQEPGMHNKGPQPISLQRPKLEALRPSKTCHHAAIEPESLKYFVGGASELYSQQKLGGRCGPLKPDVGKHANKMREAGACWRCRLSKMKVI